MEVKTRLLQAVWRLPVLCSAERLALSGLVGERHDQAGLWRLLYRVLEYGLQPEMHLDLQRRLLVIDQRHVPESLSLQVAAI